MSTPVTTTPEYAFSGWGGFSKNSVKGELKQFTYEPKKWDETDVDIKILYCGVCASDLHILSSGWFEVNYPQVRPHLPSFRASADPRD